MANNTELRKFIDAVENAKQEPIIDVTLDDTQDFHEEYGYLAYCEDGLFEA